MLLSYLFIANLLLISFVGASLSNFFDDCLQDGMIFEKYGNLIRGKYLLKPLGGCVICTNFWITAIVYISYFNSLDIYIIASIVISNTFLRFIMK